MDIGQNVKLVCASHEINHERKKGRAGKRTYKDIVIGNRCWIGTGVIILPGITISDGCVIGAGAVVTKDTEPDCIYIGCPAKKLREIK